MGLFGKGEDGFLIDFFKKNKEQPQTGSSWNHSSASPYSRFLKAKPKKKIQTSYRRQTLPVERVWLNILHSEKFLTNKEEQPNDGLVIGYGFVLSSDVERQRCVKNATEGNASLKTILSGSIALNEEDARNLTVEWTKVVFASTKRVISNFYDLPIGIRMALVEYAYYKGLAVFEKEPKIREFVETNNFEGLYKYISSNKPDARYKRVAELIKIKS